MFFSSKRSTGPSEQKKKPMPDEFCWYERMQKLIKEHESREIQIYAELRDEMQRFYSDLVKEQKSIDQKLTKLQREFDRSSAVLAIIKYLVPIGGVVAGVVWWLKGVIE